MGFLDKIKEKVDERLEIATTQVQRRKLEKELVKSFESHIQDIRQDLVILNESPQLLNVIALGEAFDAICDKISQDPDLGSPTHFQFLNVVRRYSREIQKTIDDMKYRFEFDNPEKFRVETRRSTGYVDMIFSSLKSIVNDFNQLEQERKLRKNEQTSQGTQESEQEGTASISFTYEDYLQNGMDPPLSLKIKKKIQDTLHPELIPENLQQIEEFRKSMTEDQKKQIAHELSMKEEENLLQEYLQEEWDFLVQHESMGNYLHISKLGQHWYKYLETLSEEIRTDPSFTNQRYSLVKMAREKYLELEDWLKRVEVKYENKDNRKADESKILKEEFTKIETRFAEMKAIFILQQENRNIWNLINNAEKIQRKEERAKQKALEAEQKAQDRAARDAEKLRLKEEKEKQKEIEAERKAQEKAVQEAEKARLKEEQGKQKTLEAEQKAQEKAAQEAEKARLKEEQEKQKTLEAEQQAQEKTAQEIENQEAQELEEEDRDSESDEDAEN